MILTVLLSDNVRSELFLACFGVRAQNFQYLFLCVMARNVYLLSVTTYRWPSERPCFWAMPVKQFSEMTRVDHCACGKLAISLFPV